MTCCHTSKAWADKHIHVLSDRTADKLKYLAGSEAGANVFINDTLPEVTAKTLRDLEPQL